MQDIHALKYPELVFGIAGPIGIDIDAIVRTLKDVLSTVAYRSALIRITDEITSIESEVGKPVNPTFYNMMRYKMAHASAICRDNSDPAYLMRLAISAIIRERSRLIETSEKYLENDDDEEKSVVSHIDENLPSTFIQLSGEGHEISYRSAYIIRQIKRPEEVALLRKVYGAQFFLISAYGGEKSRAKILRAKIKQTDSATLTDAREAYLAGQLIEQDMSEDQDSFGQHTREAFHLADVVIDGVNKAKMQNNTERFINAVFGLNEIAPTKSEFGMNAAYMASLRSSDLSRQVGAAVLTDAGELIAQGCNEVPKAFGGTYWDGESPDFRDIKIGQDSNDILKVDVLTDLVEIMKKHGLLSEKISKAGSPMQIVRFLIGREAGIPEFESIRGALKNSKVMDLTEYGRVVHAEMNSICDAARTGVALRSSKLFTTTFPCHNCTKHILAAGIKEVVFLEPYPKSKAKELHNNEIEIEGSSRDKVNFVPFLGITPARYESVFQKSKRKRDGVAVRWQHGGPAPMVEVSSPAYLDYEKLVIRRDEADDDAIEDISLPAET
ncbi:anti-phage dCTP deaminase [Sphingomonas hylomeconis]|uniref:Anti-phage dCTP deaminase n=1 Tax=Sphingomonas hylomeconis TaxID=1395958 RepID=A0ABV7SUK8_9SPHN|nr:anti-phage dCTP deaminase [Sphingomonas hylomeconis]